MKQCCLLFLSSLLLSFSFAQQSIKQYVSKEKIAIRSVDPNNVDYSDLQSIDDAIGDKRIIMLGEQDHGDAPTFLAKTRLIKYLHEKKGFNVLAFESDFFGLTEGQKEINNDTAALRKYIKGNIFTIWTNCDACDGLFYDYLPQRLKSAQPIIVTGFDSQPHSSYSRRKVIKYLDSVLTEERFPLSNFDHMKKQVLSWTDTLTKKYGVKFARSPGNDSITRYLNLFADYNRNHYGKNNTYYLLMSIIAYNAQTHATGLIAYDVRDAQMAANLDWLVNEKYKKEKIIVWAHNYHIMDKSYDAMSKKSSPHHSMGNEFLKDSINRQQTYVLGFDLRSGTAGRVTIKKTFKVRKPEKNSIEKWFGKDDYSFIDFKKYNQSVKEPEFFYMKGKYHRQNALAQWTRCFDGIFFIKEMYPCKRFY